MTDAEVAVAEQLVLDAEDLATLDREMAAAHEPHRLAPGGAVERLGYGSPPVDHHRFGVLVGDREATDVEALERVRALDHRIGKAVDAPQEMIARHVCVE